MINIFNELKALFSEILLEISKEQKISLNQENFEKFIIEPSKDKKHGDFACNIAMVLFKEFSAKFKNPREFALEIIKKISDKNVVKLEIAGPGFINIFARNEIFYSVLYDLLKIKEIKYPNLGNSKKVNLEYASPNPTGPIHVGHTRGAIYGDVLANLLAKVGYDVLKEYYINDAGTQIVVLLKSAYIRYLQAIGKYNQEMPEGFYPGEYLKEIGEKIKENFGDNIQDLYNIHRDSAGKILQIFVNNKYPDNSKIFQDYRDFVVESMVNNIKYDLGELGIIHNSYFSEKKELHDTNKIKEIIDLLRKTKNAKGEFFIYEGQLEAPKTQKGITQVNVELDKITQEKDQVIFRSTSYEDDEDRVVMKYDRDPTKDSASAELLPTYFAADLAYIRSKLERGASKIIMPLGFDHAGYIKRMEAALEAIKKALIEKYPKTKIDQNAQIKIILCQMVKFIKNGEPLKMSKRAGNFITAKEVIDEVGADALRFIMLTRKNDTPFDFDLSKVIEQSKDNPIFYVQYAHARCCSVLRNLYGENLLTNIENEEIDFAVLQNLKDETEIEIIKKIIEFPRVIEMSAIALEPHRIAFYLQELAAIFHSLWNKGSENKDLKFIIKENLEITKARIYLILATKLIIKNGLEIFNIKAIEEMR